MSFLGLKFRKAKYKLFLFFFIILIEFILFYFTRYIQYEIRIYRTNWFFDSLPSFNFTMGLPFILWALSGFTFKKSLIISLCVGIAHEFLRYYEYGIPIDFLDILFLLIGGLFAILIYYCMLIFLMKFGK